MVIHKLLETRSVFLYILAITVLAALAFVHQCRQKPTDACVQVIDKSITYRITGWKDGEYFDVTVSPKPE